MKNEITIGIAIAVATAVWIIFESYLANVLNRPDLGIYTGILAAAIPVIGLYYLISQMKKQLNRLPTFKEAFKSSLIVSLISGILLAVFIFIYLSQFPSSIENYLRYAEQSMLDAGQSAEEIQASIERLRESYKPNLQALYFLISTTITGTILGLLILWVMKKKQGTV